MLRHDPSLPNYEPIYRDSFRDSLQPREEKKESKRQDRQEDVPVSVAASSEVFGAVHERRSQENPYLRETTYELVQGLYQEGIQLDLSTARKVVTSLEILKTQYFPGERLDPKNEKHFDTFQLLVSVQQQSDTSYLERYDGHTVLNAQKHIENFEHQPHENLKRVVRESAILDAVCMGVPVAGPFLKEALNQSTKPREESAIGLQDLRNHGCVEKDTRTISIEHLIPTARDKLDPAAKQVLVESYAEHIYRIDSTVTGLVGAKEEQDVAIVVLTKEIQQIKEDAAIDKKQNESAEKAAKKTTKKEKEAGWNKNITNSFVCVASMARAFNEGWDRLKDDEYLDKAQTREFLKAAKRTQEELDRDNTPVTSVINTRNIVENTRQNRESITKIETLLGDIKGFIQERGKIASSGDVQAEQLKAANTRIQKAYVELKKEQQKVRERFGYISLATRVIGAGLSAFPACQIAGAAVTIGGEVIHAVGSHVDGGYRKQEEHHNKLADKYYEISSSLGAVVQKNHRTLHQLSDQKEYLTDVLLTHLQRDPIDHAKFMNYLENGLSENRGELTKVRQEVSKQEGAKGLIAHKKDAVAAAKRYLNDKKKEDFDAKGKKEREKTEEKVRKAEAKLAKAEEELLAQQELLEGFQEQEKILAGKEKNFESGLEDAKRIQNIQASHAECREKLGCLFDLLDHSSKHLGVAQALKNIDEIGAAAEGTRQMVANALSRINKLATAVDGYFDTNISQRIHTPSVAISKTSAILTGLVQITHAFDQSLAVNKDQQGLTAASSSSDSAEEESKDTAVPVMGMLKLGLKIVDPTSAVIIAGLELLSLSQDKEPSEMRQLKEALQDFQSNIRNDIRGLHRHLGDLHRDLVGGFTYVDNRLEVFEQNITLDIAALGERLETVTDNQTAEQAFLSVFSDLRTFQDEMTPYRSYVEEERHFLEERDIQSIFLALRTKRGQLTHRHNNGLWLGRRLLLDQLALASDDPQHCMGLLAEHMISGHASNLYQYEHYTYVFSRIGAKVLLDDIHRERFKGEVQAQSQELIVHGSAINALFSQDLLEETLVEYLKSQNALVTALKEEEKRVTENNKTALVQIGQGWLRKHKELQYLVPTASEQCHWFLRAPRPRLMGAKTFLFLNHVHRPIATRDIEEVAYKNIYLEMLRQQAFEGWKETEVLGTRLGSAAYLPYTFSTAIGGGANGAAYEKRSSELPRLMSDAKRLQQLSLVELFTGGSIPQINADKRSAIMGNFIEVAYKIDRLKGCIRLCNNYNEGPISYQSGGGWSFDDVSNPLHRNITLPNPDDSSCKGSMREFYIRNALRETQRMATKSFNDLFVFSVVHTAEAQENNGLSGKTFLVLSDHLNREGLRLLMMRSSGLDAERLIEHKHFPVGGKEYTIMPTVGDGACALHALLGTRGEDGQYYQEQAKVNFRERLSSMYEHAKYLASPASYPHYYRQYTPDNETCKRVKDKLIQTLKNHLNSALKNGNASSTMLFPDTRPPLIPGIKGHWKELQDSHAEKRKVLKDQESPLWLAYVGNDAFMDKVMSEVADLKVKAEQAITDGDRARAEELRNKPFYEKTRDQVIEISRENPSYLMDLVDCISEECLRLIEDQGISDIRQEQEGLRNRQEAVESDFVFQDEVIRRYLETLVLEDFYFNTEEIEIAALMFDKKAHVVSTRRDGKGIEPSEKVFNKGIPGDPVVIYHEGIHFQRCVTLQELRPEQAIAEQHSDPQISADFKNKYDASVKKLVNDYAEFLEMQGGGDIPDPADNPFLDNDKFPVGDKKNPLIKLLTPTNENHVPLAFPAAFLDRIERNFPVDELNRVDTGKILMPHYGFGFNEDEGCYDLSIAYQVLERGELPKEYYSFVVAQIGRDTVDAFRDKYRYSPDHKDFFHNEFLIQAMYTNFADEQTLPGKLSFRLLETHAESVIPIEEQFDGLFQRFAELGDPEPPPLNKVCFGHRQRRLPNDRQLTYNPFAEISPTVNEDCFKDCFILEKERLLAKKDQTQRMKKGPEYTELYKDAQKNYLLLKSLLNLVLDESARKKIMRRIYSPDAVLESRHIVDSIYADLTSKEEPCAQAKQLRDDVLASYDASPSIERLLIQQHLENLKAIAIHARGEEDHTEKLSVIAAFGKAQPFSNYGAQEHV